LQNDAREDILINALLGRQRLVFTQGKRVPMVLNGRARGMGSDQTNIRTKMALMT
jgi:hypothetical protein